MKFTNNWSYNVCWKGINVAPGETVELRKNKKREVKEDGME